MDLKYDARYHIERYLESEGIFLDCFEYNYGDISFLVDRFRGGNTDLEAGYMHPLHPMESSSESIPLPGPNLCAQDSENIIDPMENLLCSSALLNSMLKSYDDSELDATNCYETMAGSYGQHDSPRSLETGIEEAKAPESESSSTNLSQLSQENKSCLPCAGDSSTAGISEQFNPVDKRATLLSPFVPRPNNPKYRRGSKKTVEHEMALLSPGPGTLRTPQQPLNSRSDSELETPPQKTTSS